MAVSLPSARAGGRVCAIAGVVDVWRVELSRASGDGLAQLLCARERERAARIVDARRRALWMRSRGALRALLARYLDADPRGLRFEYGEHGKPALGERAAYATGSDGESDLRFTDLRFNLSHSGELMLVAVTAGREVGVDLECARGRHTAELLRAWTVREARVKCLGAGLSAASAAGASGALEELWTAALDVGARASAAIAVAGGEECELRRRDWLE